MPSEQVNQLGNCPHGASDAEYGQHPAPCRQRKPQLVARPIRHVAATGKYQRHIHGRVDERDGPVSDDPRVEVVVVEGLFEGKHFGVEHRRRIAIRQHRR